MKNFLLLFLVLSFSCLYSQCPTSNIYLSSQEDIDNFKSRYPGCTQFNKELHIYGDDITNLNGLDELTATTYVVNISRTSLVNLTGLDNITEMGTLKIFNNELLENLSGIGQLTEIDGNFTLQNNSELTDLTDLSNLTNVEYVFDIDNNDALLQLSGLDNLSNVGSIVLQNGRLSDISSLYNLQNIRYNFTVENEYSLQNLENFSNLLGIGGNVKIASNRVLESISGFNAVSSVRNLEVFDNEALVNITGFNQLEIINGDLMIGSSPTYKWGDNTVLADISGLFSLQTIVQNFYIGENYALTNLNGLQNLSSVGADTHIFKNDSLISLEGLNGLVSVGGQFLVSFNPVLLETNALLRLETVGDNVGIWSNNTLQSLTGLDGLKTVGGNLDIGWNPTVYLQDFGRTRSLKALNLKELTHVTDDFRIGFCAIPVIDDINKLSHVGGKVAIGYSEEMTEISGLNQLTTVSQIEILEVQQLHTISGFSSLVTLPNHLDISRNPDLTTITGFQSLQSIDQDLILSYNPNLSDASGFNQLRNIGENFSLENKSLSFGNNSNQSGFQNFQSFSNLETIGKDFIIGPNVNLVNFTGLENLSSIGKNFLIKTGLPQSNAPHISSLTSMVGLTNLQNIEGWLRIENNSELMTLNGLSALSNVGNNFEITNNIKLENFNTLNSLTTLGRDFNISNNPSLINFTGLESLQTVTGNLKIEGNIALENLSGLNNLSAVGDLQIFSNQALLNIESLGALSQISSVYSSVRISNNESLVSLVGLENITSLKSLTLFFNSNLESLEGLDSLRVLTEYLSIDRNPLLNDISALQNTEIDRNVRLGIKNNASLAACNIKSICKFTTYANTDSFIYNNLPGCDSKYEIYLRCPNPDDLDGDGVLNSIEEVDGTDINDGCSYFEANQDADLISVLWEEADCDNDGIPNGTELTNGSNPRNEDSDGDGVLDSEDQSPTDACIPAQNQDYIGYDANNEIWQSFDCDGDDVQNGAELIAGTNPYYNESFYSDSTYPETFYKQEIETNGRANAIATNGTTVAVGRTTSVTGVVEIYEKDTSGIWQETQVISPTTLSPRFGWKLALTANTLFVTQPYADENQSDVLFIYQKNQSGDWVETQQIKASSEFTYDGFGSSISVNDNTLVVGADGIAPSGAVYVFEKTTNNTWTEIAEIYPSEDLFDGAFGESVAISNNTIVIGASGYDEFGAFVYEKQNDNSWQEVQSLSASDGNNFTYARDVAISGNRILIGDVGHTNLSYEQGHALIYEKSYEGEWIQVKTLEASNGYQEDFFADALAMNNNRIVVNLSADQLDIGYLHIFHKSEGNWIETHILSDPGPEYSNYDFGYHVAVADGLIVTTSGEFVHFFEDIDYTEADSDGDGLTDSNDSHPSDPCLPVQNEDYTNFDSENEIWANADCDGDGVTNGEEVAHNTNPYVSDIPAAICQEITSSDGAVSDFFGKVMAISEDEKTIAISSYNDDDLGNNSGSVYIFNQNNSGNWVETQKLNASDGQVDDVFGLSMTFAGETLAISAYKQNHNTGAVYLFDQSPTGVWEEVQKLLPSDTALYQQFGYSISGIENYLIIGAQNNAENGTNSGAAYIFNRDSNGTWIESKKLTASDGEAHDNFGISVAITTNTAVVGAWYDDDSIENSGAAYIFEYLSNDWVEVAKVKASDISSGSGYATSVAIENQTLVVGAASINNNDTHTGSAYVYEKSSGVWSQTQKLIPTNGAAQDRFGLHVAINNNRIVCGISGNDENGPSRGAVQVFEKQNNVNWNATQKLLACDLGSDYANFGNGVALSKNLVVAGTNFFSATGSAYVFELKENIPNDELELSVNITNISCHGSNDASIIGTAIGGTPPYVFILETPALGNTNGNTTGEFYNVASGEYIFILKDNSGDEVSVPVSITETAPLNIIASVDQVCEPNANGQITIQGTGGTLPYQFSIDNGVTFQSNAIFNNLSAADYQIIAQDANGCTVTQVVTVDVDAQCVPFTLPANNFTIETTSETCASSNNGSILLKADKNLDYTATLNGEMIHDSKDFRSFTNFQDLEAGIYELCITVAQHPSYSKCFTMQITEPAELEVESETDSSGKTVSLSLKGANEYYITVNGISYSTTNDYITLPLAKLENSIKVKTDKQCQGVFETTLLTTYDSISIFPNPVEHGDVTVHLNSNTPNTKVLLSLFSQNGTRVFETIKEEQGGSVQFNMDDLPAGVYTILVTSASKNYMRKIIKK